MLVALQSITKSTAPLNYFHPHLDPTIPYSIALRRPVPRALQVEGGSVPLAALLKVVSRVVSRVVFAIRLGSTLMKKWRVSMCKKFMFFVHGRASVGSNGERERVNLNRLQFLSYKFMNTPLSLLTTNHHYFTAGEYWSPEMREWTRNNAKVMTTKILKY